MPVRNYLESKYILTRARVSQPAKCHDDYIHIQLILLRMFTTGTSGQEFPMKTREAKLSDFPPKRPASITVIKTYPATAGIVLRNCTAVR
jgi:hypothetical protein